jgi:ribonuclease D
VNPWIRSPEELARFAATLAGCRALALDTESDSLHHHFEKVCLVQIATDGGEARLVDPLALRDLEPLGPIFADAGVVKVLHGADYDVATLKRDFGFRFAGLFDTMIAARFLGLPEIGLQALLRTELGVSLSKDSQKDDWSRRPLSPRQEAYALDDVRHLLHLQGRLAARLRSLGRLSWVEEECVAVAALEPARRRADPEIYQRIKGAGRLAPRGLAVLRELHAWREGQAEATDVPPFKILGNEALLALSDGPPRSLEELGRVRGVLPRLRGQAPALLAAVARALALTDTDLPQRARSPRPVVSEEARRRTEGLKLWRAEEARRAGLDVSVVLPQRLIDRLAEADPRDLEALGALPGLRRWRVEAYGPALLAALRGREGRVS